jgi:hypothetical protein
LDEEDASSASAQHHKQHNHSTVLNFMRWTLNLDLHLQAAEGEEEQE